MYITNIIAHNLPDAWYQCLSAIMAGEGVREYQITRGSYEGKYRREFEFIVLRITDPGTPPLVPDMPPGLGLTPPTTADYVAEYFANYLLSPELKPDESYTYGNRIFNQIFKVIDIFIKDGHGTNQTTMEIAMPSDLALHEPPCLRLIDCRIQDGKLNFVLYFRSWDLWGGLPANLAGLQLLKAFMASEIGVEDGEIVAVSKGLHLYDYAWDFARQRVYGED